MLSPDVKQEVAKKLSPDTRKQIEEMVRQNIHGATIVERLGLEDPNLIYEIRYENGIKNRVDIADEKHAATLKAAGLASESDRIVQLIETYMRSGGITDAKFLDQGSGNGSLTARVASSFPQAQVNGIELTEAGIEYARDHFKADNLSFEHGDAYQMEATGRYDVVFHNNVLEHVPNPVRFLEAGLKALKENGVLVIGFPTRGYWVFWGWPKYLACKLLGREFLYHGWDTRALDKFISENQLTCVHKEYVEFCLPRRLYYYLPNRALPLAGKFLSYIGAALNAVRFTHPFLNVNYVIAKKPVPFHLAAKSKESKNPVFMALKMVWVAPSALAVLLFSNVMMTWEVVQGRRPIFQQT